MPALNSREDVCPASKFIAFSISIFPTQFELRGAARGCVLSVNLPRCFCDQRSALVGFGNRLTPVSAATSLLIRLHVTFQFESANSTRNLGGSAVEPLDKLLAGDRCSPVPLPRCPTAVAQTTENSGEPAPCRSLHMAARLHCLS